MSIRVTFRPKINQNCIPQLVEKNTKNRFHSVLNCTGFGAVLHGAKQLIPSGMGFMQQGSSSAVLHGAKHLIVAGMGSMQQGSFVI